MKFLHLKGIGIVIFPVTIDHDQFLQKLSSLTNADVKSAGFIKSHDLQVSRDFGSTSFNMKGTQADQDQLDHQI